MELTLASIKSFTSIKQSNTPIKNNFRNLSLQSISQKTHNLKFYGTLQSFLYILEINKVLDREKN